MSAPVLCPDCGHATRQHAEYGCVRQRCVCAWTKTDLVNSVVQVPSISGPIAGPVVKPHCRGCGRWVGACTCSDERMGVRDA